MNSTSLMGRSGIAIYALAALDISFWDASAKIANQPLCEHLGGSIAPVKAYNSCGLWLDGNESLYDEAKQLMERGDFDVLKINSFSVFNLLIKSFDSKIMPIFKSFNKSVLIFLISKSILFLK